MTGRDAGGRFKHRHVWTVAALFSAEGDRLSTDWKTGRDGAVAMVGVPLSQAPDRIVQGCTCGEVVVRVLPRLDTDYQHGRAVLVPRRLEALEV